jgi:ABC-type sugar transport system permease subunit
MAEAAIDSAPSRGILYKVRSFLNAKLVIIFAGGLFALLAIFLIYPIISVLVKSFWGDDGFTLDFYVEFFSYNFYYWSLFNTLILGFSTMIILNVRKNIGFGLKLKKWPRDKIDTRVEELLALVHMEGLGDRSIR